MCELTAKKCMPCEYGAHPLDNADEDRFHLETPVWGLNRDGIHKLSRNFKFRDFAAAMVFVNDIARLAEDEGHHPDIAISWNNVTLTLWTHAIGGLSENDFIMAAKIDRLCPAPMCYT